MAQIKQEGVETSKAGRLVHVKDLWRKRESLRRYVIPLVPECCPPQPSEVQAAAAAVLAMRSKSLPEVDLTDPGFRGTLCKAGVQIAEVVDGDVHLYGKPGHNQPGILLWQDAHKYFAVPYAGVRKRVYTQGIGFIHMLPAAEESPEVPTNGQAEAKPLNKREATKSASVDKGRVRTAASRRVERRQTQSPVQPASCSPQPRAVKESTPTQGKEATKSLRRAEKQGRAQEPVKEETETKTSARSPRPGKAAPLEKGPKQVPVLDQNRALTGLKGESGKPKRKPSQPSQETGTGSTAPALKGGKASSKVMLFMQRFEREHDEIIREAESSLQKVLEKHQGELGRLIEEQVVRSAKIYFTALEVAEKTWRGRLEAEERSEVETLERTFFSFNLGRRLAIGQDLPPTTQKTEWYCAREQAGHECHRRKPQDISAFRRFLKSAADLLELRPSILCGRRIYAGTVFYSRLGSPSNGKTLMDGLWNPAQLKGFEMDCGVISHLRFLQIVRLESEQVALFTLPTHEGFHLLPGCKIKSPVFRISDRSLPVLSVVKGPTRDAEYRIMYHAVTAHAPREVQALISLAKMEEFSLPARSGVEPSRVATSVVELERQLQSVWPNGDFDLK